MQSFPSICTCASYHVHLGGAQLHDLGLEAIELGDLRQLGRLLIVGKHLDLALAVVLEERQVRAMVAMVSDREM
jgi:hypothetical protein